MKTENLISAIVGGIVAGAAFGAGFAIAGKGMAKLGKKEKEIASEIVATKPMQLPAGAGSGMSNLTGKGLVHSDSWSNARGFTSKAIKASAGFCKKDNSTVPVASADDCRDGHFIKF